MGRRSVACGTVSLGVIMVPAALVGTFSVYHQDITEFGAAILGYTGSATRSKVTEEKYEAEKATKLAGVAYWVKDKDMMGDSLRKTAEFSELSRADTEHSGYPRA